MNFSTRRSLVSKKDQMCKNWEDGSCKFGDKSVLFIYTGVYIFQNYSTPGGNGFWWMGGGMQMWLQKASFFILFDSIHPKNHLFSPIQRKIPRRGKIIFRNIYAPVFIFSRLTFTKINIAGYILFLRPSALPLPIQTTDTIVAVHYTEQG